MKNKITLLLLALMAFMVMPACISDNKTDYSEYTECAIKAFTLGDIEYQDTLRNQYDEDSIVTRKITGSNYTFTIDQNKRLIYNTDSLPKGTPVDKVVVTVTSDGYTYYRNKKYDSSDSESSEWLSVSSDSIDFTTPETFRVIAYNGNVYRDYSIMVNVHQEDADSTYWKKVGTAYSGAVLQRPRAVTFGNKVAVLGTINDSLMVTVANNGSNEWSQVQSVTTLSGKAQYLSVTSFQDKLYIVEDQQLFVSDNAVNWEAVASDKNIQTLMGASNKQLFALSDSLFVSSSNAANWETEVTEYPALVPNEYVFSHTMQLSNNTQINRTVLLGQIAESTDSIAPVWYRQGVDSWSYMYTSLNNSYALPNLENLVVLYYKEYFIALGGIKRGTKYPGKALSKLYASLDNGLTWKTQDDDDFNTYPTLPSEIEGNTHAFTAYVDKNYYIWILFQGTGDVWCGRLNRMGFTD